MTLQVYKKQSKKQTEGKNNKGEQSCLREEEEKTC